MMNEGRPLLLRTLLNVVVAIVAFGTINLLSSLLSHFDSLEQTIILTLVTGGVIGLVTGLGNRSAQAATIPGAVIGAIAFVVLTVVFAHSMATPVSIGYRGYVRIAIAGLVEGAVTGWITGNINE